jgi:hypothetical protein
MCSYVSPVSCPAPVGRRVAYLQDTLAMAVLHARAVHYCTSIHCVAHIVWERKCMAPAACASGHALGPFTRRRFRWVPFKGRRARSRLGDVLSDLGQHTC